MFPKIILMPHAIHPATQRVSRIPVRVIRSYYVGQIARVVFEATGPYHKGLEQRLNLTGLTIAKVNPRQARRFAEATGRLAKTDRVDALMLARFGALLEPVSRPVRTEIQNQLTELVAARRSLVRDRTALLNRAQILTIELLKRHARHRLRQINAQIMLLDTAIETIIGEDPVLTRRREILLSIPGLGHVTAQALLADMPEPGAMDETQAASLAGLAPVTRQSGKWQGKSFIRGDALIFGRRSTCPLSSPCGSIPI